MSETKNLSVHAIKILPTSNLYGDFQLPGDKSISHRAAILASLGEGETRLRNYSTARDCQSTLDCLEALGVQVDRKSDLVTVGGGGLYSLRQATEMLDAGNSGSTIRMLAGILAGQTFTTSITGDESIQQRPMRRIIDPLTLMGAKITAREEKFAPLFITGGDLEAIEYSPPIASAQVKTCVLFAGLFAHGRTTVIETTPTRNHTEVMLRECGSAIEIQSAANGERISITGRNSLRALGDYTVAGDLSSAAFFIVAASILHASPCWMCSKGSARGSRSKMPVWYTVNLWPTFSCDHPG
jgi:3-phosphoshikimate 1-carboxyvinyltransferase